MKKPAELVKTLGDGFGLKEEWMAALKEANYSLLEAVDERWETIYQLMETWHVSAPQVRRKIKILEGMGRVEKKKFPIWTGDRLLPVMHYAIKK